MLLATLIAAVVQRRQVTLAALALAIIPVQAIIGGISVLTDLNPWVVALHFLTSMAAIAVTVLLWWRVRDAPAPASSRAGRGGSSPVSWSSSWPRFSCSAPS